MNCFLSILLLLATGFASAIPSPVNWSENSSTPQQLSQRAVPAACNSYHAPVATHDSLSDLIMGNKVKENQVSLENHAVEFGLILYQPNMLATCYRVQQPDGRNLEHESKVVYILADRTVDKPCVCNQAAGYAAWTMDHLRMHGYTKLLQWYEIDVETPFEEASMCIWDKSLAGDKGLCKCDVTELWKKYKQAIEKGCAGKVGPNMPQFLPGSAVPSDEWMDKLITDDPE